MDLYMVKSCLSATSLCHLFITPDLEDCFSSPNPTSVNEMKWIFIHSWHLLRSKVLLTLLHSIQQMLHSCLIPLFGDLKYHLMYLRQVLHSIFHSFWHLFQLNFGSYFILPCILSHSHPAAVSLNISFFLAFISIKFSFLCGSYFILSCILEVFTFPGIIHIESTWNPWNPCGIPCGIHGINVGRDHRQFIVPWTSWIPYGMIMEWAWNGQFHMESISIPHGFHWIP